MMINDDQWWIVMNIYDELMMNLCWTSDESMTYLCWWWIYDEWWLSYDEFVIKPGLIHDE